MPNSPGVASAGSKEQDLRGPECGEGSVKAPLESTPFDPQTVLCLFQGQYEVHKRGCRQA